MAFDGSGNVALVEAPAARGPERWLFLPGGGIEAGETPEECIRRECLEETGCEVQVEKYLCTGEEYFFSARWKEYLHMVGRCYLATLGKKVQEPVEKDHVLLWVPAVDCGEHMFLNYQAWAVETGLKEREHME